MKPTLILYFSFFVCFFSHAEEKPFVLPKEQAARTVEESKRFFHERGRRVAEHFANFDIPEFSHEYHTRFIVTTLSRLVLKKDINQVNEALLSTDTLPFRNVGSTFKTLGKACFRLGDYDFILRGLTRIYGLFKNQPDVLWPETQEKLLTTLFTLRGKKHHLYSYFKLCGWQKETENHVLMMESSRYLANQFLLEKGITLGNDSLEDYDNEKNGFNDWMVEHLSQFLRTDFEEYNGRPYQGYSVLPIQNLYDFSNNERVKSAAKLVLDYLSARFASQSNGLRRFPPFRRKKTERSNTQVFKDPETGRFLQLAGNYQRFDSTKIPYSPEYGLHFMFWASTSSYRVPDSILKMILRNNKNEIFQKTHHKNVEIYHQSKNFLLSAGGHFQDDLKDFATGELDGWARPSLLIPSLGGGQDSHDYIRFAGHKKRILRKNTCVAPNFMCGLNPRVPENIPLTCQKNLPEYPNWKFFDFKSKECPHHWNIFVALYEKRCDSLRCYAGGKTFGLMEVVEASRFKNFEDFRLKVVMQNGRTHFKSGKKNHYKKTDGTSVTFLPARSLLRTWEITHLNGKKQQIRFRKWPFHSGDLIRSSGNGEIEIRFPEEKKSLILDFKNRLYPLEYERFW